MSNTQKLTLDLAHGLQEMNVDLCDEKQQKLIHYIALLCKWNSTYNLTALRNEDKMLSHHVLDSLTVLAALPNHSGSLIDVGSGGGMPGIPLAIARPDWQITLIDSNSKKTAFLQQAVIELALDNITVQTGRIEALHGQQFNIITSRAFAELNDFVRVSRQLLAPNGTWLAMKGVYPYEEIEQLPENVVVDEVRVVQVPQLNAERHLVFMHAIGD